MRATNTCRALSLGAVLGLTGCMTVRKDQKHDQRDQGKVERHERKAERREERAERREGRHEKRDAHQRYAQEQDSE